MAATNVLNGALVVDDEAEIGKPVAAFLKSAGFRTFVANGGVQALEVFGEHRTEIDVLVTDFIMPDLFGDQLAARLLNDKPKLQVVFMSGNSADSLYSTVDLEEE